MWGYLLGKRHLDLKHPLHEYPKDEAIGDFMAALLGPIALVSIVLPNLIDRSWWKG